VVAALILVAVIIVVVIRMRGGGERDDKDYDDGGLSSSGRRCVAGNADKASTEPLNKDLNDSVDSLEEKNPDIIPQNNGEDDYQDEERAFERLNNAPVRVYGRMHSPQQPDQEWDLRHLLHQNGKKNKRSSSTFSLKENTKKQFCQIRAWCSVAL
jgi:hypothetical protein